MGIIDKGVEKVVGNKSKATSKLSPEYVIPHLIEWICNKLSSMWNNKGKSSKLKEKLFREMNK